MSISHDNINTESTTNGSGDNFRNDIKYVRKKIGKYEVTIAVDLDNRFIQIIEISEKTDPQIVKRYYRKGMTYDIKILDDNDDE